MAQTTVNVSAPLDGASFALNSAITLSANVTPAAGETITKVEFRRDNNILIGTATSAPWRITWNNVPGGDYAIAAIAYDTSPNYTYSSSISLNVGGPLQVQVVAPSNQSVFGARSTIALTATATREGQPVALSSLKFRKNGAILSTLTAAPYSYVWSEVASGAYSIEAQATELNGNYIYSVPVTVNVARAPTVSLTAPISGSTLQLSGSYTLSANATRGDSYTTIAKVEFFANGQLVGSVPTAPYGFTWTPSLAGSYTLTAVATDSLGGTKVSTARTVTVLSTVPSISLTAPQAMQNFMAPAEISLTANAAPGSGQTLSKVEFYSGTTLVGTASNSPYSAVWSNVAAGSYSLTAKAIDSQGISAISAPVSITVTSGAQVYYLHTDHLNTPRLVTDEQNKVIWRSQPLAEPFGVSPPEEDPDGNGATFALNLRFPGQYFDKETNLSYNYFRDYNPATGRYVESDPIGLQGGINTYGYVGGNPLSYIDPTGLDNPGMGPYGGTAPPSGPLGRDPNQYWAGQPPSSPPMQCGCDDKYKVSLRCFIVTVDFTVPQSVPRGGWSLSWIGVGPSGLGAKAQLVKVCKCVADSGWYIGAKGTGSAGVGPLGAEASGTIQFFPPGAQGSVSGSSSTAGYATPGLSGQVGIGR